MQKLLLELCQTSPSQCAGSPVQSQSHSHPQSQPYLSSQTQSIGEFKLQKLQRSHSLLSAHSLFLDGEEEECEVEEEEDGREVEEDLAGPEKSSDKLGLEEGGVEDDEYVEVNSGDDLFIAMETELDNRKYSSPVVKISSESEQQQLAMPPQSATARSRLNLDFQQREKGGGRKGSPISPFRSPKPTRLRYKGEETDEDSEVELPISTPLASPIPPSPKSKELQSDILKELDSFSSSCDEVGRELTDSQFGIPYSQLQTPSSQCNTYSESHPELDKVWNSTAAAATMATESSSDTQSPLKLGGEETSVVGRLGQSVQLEYDMPEITASQLETSSDSLYINPLETDSPRSLPVKGHQSPLLKGQSSSSKGPSPLVTHQQTSRMKGHQAAMTSSLRKAKRQLLHKPAAGGSGKGASPKSSVSSRTRSKRKHRDIPQLDGADDKSLSSTTTTSGKALSRKRKRTLGLQRRRKKQSKSSRQSVVETLVLEEEVASTSSEVEEQSSLPGAIVEEAVTGSDTQEGEGDPSSHSLAAGLPSKEGVETGDQVLLEEDKLSNIQCGLVETGVWESTPEASHDESGEASGQQSTKEKARLSLSLNKSGNRTHRTRESDPDMFITETVFNPNWRAETERDSEMIAALSSPVRTREKATHPEVVCSPSRKVSKHLKEQVLRRGPILKINKLSTDVLQSMKGNTAAASKGAGEQSTMKPSSKRRKMSVTPSSSGSLEADLSNNRDTNEREERYKRMCQKRGSRHRWSPKFLKEMSYEQQLKKAIEISKQTYLAESAQQQLQYDAESAELAQDNAEPAQSQDDAESSQIQDGAESAQLQLPDIVQGGGGGVEWEEPREQLGLGSPLMFSPPSSDDMDRMVVEESPLREGGGLDEGIVNEKDLCCLDERREEEETEAAPATVGDGDNEWNLDMSISSISESPPYTSSPALAAGGEREGEREEGGKDKGEEEVLLHDSSLKLRLETSLSSPPPQSSSPLHLTHEPPFDADTSFLSEDSFPCVILASEIAAKETVGDNKETSLMLPSSPTEEGQDSVEGPSRLLATPSKTVMELEPTTTDENLHVNPPLPSDYPVVTMMMASPEGSEIQSEADQVLSSQMDVSVSSEEDFHLSIGTCSSSSEDEVGGGRESPDLLNFSTEKTSLAVRFQRYVSPRESQYQAKDKESKRPQHLSKGETATSNVIMLGDDDGSELAPPTLKELAESASSYGLPSMRHQEPFCSSPADVQRPL